MNILSDPTMDRLARMIYVGQQACFPKLQFISNRLKIEKLIEEARRNTRIDPNALLTPSIEKSQLRSMLSSEDLEQLLEQARGHGGHIAAPTLLTPPLALPSAAATAHTSPHRRDNASDAGTITPATPRSASTHRRTATDKSSRPESPSLSKRFSDWFGTGSAQHSPRASIDALRPSLRELRRESSQARRSSVLVELERQMRVFSDDTETEGEEEDEEGEDGEEDGSESVGMGDEDALLFSNERETANGRAHQHLGADDEWKRYGGGETEESDDYDDDVDADDAVQIEEARTVDEANEVLDEKRRGWKGTFVS